MGSTKNKAATRNKVYDLLISEIGNTLEEGRKNALRVVNTILVGTYWQIGRQIVEYEQRTGVNAGYGSNLFDRMALDLKQRYGKGFSRSNIVYMRLLYSRYQKSQTLYDQLSWSHYVELLGIDDELERSFYEKECLLEKWSVRELSRQINSMLFQRLALSRDRKGVLQLARKGQLAERPEDEEEYGEVIANQSRPDSSDGGGCTHPNQKAEAVSRGSRLLLASVAHPWA